MMLRCGQLSAKHDLRHDGASAYPTCGTLLWGARSGRVFTSARCCILHMRCRDCVPSIEVYRTEYKDLLLPTPPRTWRRLTTIKAVLEPLSGSRVFGYARWRKSLVGSHGATEPSVPPPAMRLNRLVKPFQPTLSECRHKFK